MKIAMKIVFALIGIAIVAAIVWRWEVNGWGALVWIAGIIGMNIIRAPFARRTQDNKIVESQKTLMEKLLLTGVLVGMLVPVIQLTSGVLSFANYSVGVWVTVAGTIVLAAGLWLFWRSHADLGRNWSVTLELREDHGLITSGVYKRVRHPMYSAIWLIVLAQPLLIHNWVVGFAGVFSFGLMYAIRTPREEAMMRKQFGVAYEDYCKKSGRLLPRFT